MIKKRGKELLNMKERKIINYVVTIEDTKELSAFTEEQRKQIIEQLHLALNYRFIEEKYEDMGNG